MPKSKITKQQIEDILQLAGNGATDSKIAETYGISARYVRQLVKRDNDNIKAEERAAEDAEMDSYRLKCGVNFEDDNVTEIRAWLERVYSKPLVSRAYTFTELDCAKILDYLRAQDDKTLVKTQDWKQGLLHASFLYEVEHPDDEDSADLFEDF